MASRCEDGTVTGDPLSMSCQIFTWILFPSLLAHSFLRVSLKDTRVGFPTHGVCWNRFLSKSFVIFDPLPPISHQDRISPYNINTISSRRVTRIKKILIRGLLVDPIPNSPNSHHHIYEADSKEGY